MTIIDGNTSQPALPACPNCGAVGTLRPLAARSDARKRGTEVEFRCTACNVVVIHARGGKEGA